MLLRVVAALLDWETSKERMRNRDVQSDGYPTAVSL